MLDFGALPPEVNSGRMYAGAGSGPMLAAATAWDGLASELSSMSAFYGSKVAELADRTWQGPSASSMAAAAGPYAAWMSNAGMQAEQAAMQARSAAAAYEAAFAATVPPPLVAANRATLAALVATNVIGQNTPAIAATETHYAEMWAQDAVAMYSYAGSSAAASQLTPFSPPNQSTNPGGVLSQAASVARAAAAKSAGSASDFMTSITGALQSLNNMPTPFAVLTSILKIPDVASLNAFVGAIATNGPFMYGPEFVGAGIVSILSPLMSLVGAAPAALTSSVAGAGAAADGSMLVGSNSSGAGMPSALGSSGVSAGMGRAVTVGSLSTPLSWATNAPAIKLTSTALPSTLLDSLAPGKTAAPGGWFGGMPPIGSVVNAPRNEVVVSQARSRLKVIPEIGGSSGAGEEASRWYSAPAARTSDATSGLSEREREELDKLRKEIAELAMERDMAARLVKEAAQR